MIKELRSILRYSFHYLLAAALPALVNFLLLPLYTHFLTAAEYGLISLTTLVQSISIVLIGMGLDGAFNRFFFMQGNDKKALGRLFATVLLCIFILAVLGALLLEVWGKELWELAFRNDQFGFSPLGRYAYLSAVGTGFYGMVLVFFKNSERAWNYLWLSIVFWLAVIGGILLGMLYFDGGVEGAVAGRMYGSLLGGGLGVVWVARELPFSLDLRWVKKAFAYGLPLAFYLLLLAASQQLDRWMVEQHLSLADLGQYHLAVMVATAPSLVALALHNVVSPSLYSLLSKDESLHAPRVKRTLHFFVISLTILAFAWFMLADFMIDLISPESYQRAGAYAGILILAQIPHFLYMIYSFPLYFYQKTKYLPLISIVMLVLGIVGFSWALPIWGAWGASLVFLGVKVAQLLMCMLINGYLRLNQKAFYPSSALSVSILILVGLFAFLQLWQEIGI